MAHRKVEHIRTQTESMRDVTVRGLVPELERLMKRHRGDLGKLRAGRVAAGQTLYMELKANYSKQQVGVWNMVRGGHVAGEVKERTRLEWCEIEMEREAREQYTRAIKDRAKASSRLHADLEEQHHKGTMWCQRKLKNVRNRANGHFRTTCGQLVRKRNLVHYLLGRGRCVVADARRVDRIVSRKTATLQSNLALAENVSVKTTGLAHFRDSAIDAMIHQIQGFALAWEASETRNADAQQGGLKGSHLVAVATIRTQRANWVERHVATLRENQGLRAQLCALKRAEAPTQWHHNHVQSRAVKPRSQAKCHAKHAHDICLKRRHAYDTILKNLNCVCIAAQTASNAATIDLQYLVALHNRSQTRVGNVYQKMLTERDGGVKLNLYIHANEIAQMKNELEIEQSRHTHLKRLLASYHAVTRACGSNGMLACAADQNGIVF